MIAAIRIRGTTGINRDIADTLTMMRLNQISHATLIEENPSYTGMLQKSKDYITWGEIDAETLSQLIAKRGRLPGGKHVTDEYIAENTDYSSIEEFSKAVLDSKVNLADAEIKPVFRLHPPRKGYESTKTSFKEGGSLGYRGENITEIIRKMM